MPASPDFFEIGLIADTHGLLRPEALSALSGVDAILHAGDVGPRDIITALEKIAPVYTVRGNTDIGEWGRTLPLRQFIDLGGERLLLYHGHIHHGEGAAHHEARVIVSGHTHVPRTEWRHSVLHVNPGSAGPRRPGLPVSVARLTLRAHGEHEVRIIEIA